MTRPQSKPAGAPVTRLLAIIAVLLVTTTALGTLLVVKSAQPVYATPPASATWAAPSASPTPPTLPTTLDPSAACYQPQRVPYTNPQQNLIWPDEYWTRLRSGNWKITAQNTDAGWNSFICIKERTP